MRYLVTCKINYEAVTTTPNTYVEASSKEEAIEKFKKLVNHKGLPQGHDFKAKEDPEDTITADQLMKELNAWDEGIKSFWKGEN